MKVSEIRELIREGTGEVLAFEDNTSDVAGSGIALAARDIDCNVVIRGGFHPTKGPATRLYSEIPLLP